MMTNVTTKKKKKTDSLTSIEKKNLQLLKKMLKTMADNSPKERPICYLD